MCIYNYNVTLSNSPALLCNENVSICGSLLTAVNSKLEIEEMKECDDSEDEVVYQLHQSIKPCTGMWR